MAPINREREIAFSDTIRRRLRYEPESGIIYWRDGKNAGEPAGDNKQDINGYYGIKICDVKFKYHRVAWFLYYGEWPKEEIDHIRGHKYDNRIEMLRQATPRENALNKIIHRNGSLPGVSYHKYSKKWESRIWEDSKKRFLGYYDTAEEAHEAYKRAYYEITGEELNI